MDRRLIKVVGIVAAGLVAAQATMADPHRADYRGGPAPQPGYSHAPSQPRPNFGYGGPQGGGYPGGNRQPGASYPNVYRQPAPPPYPGGNRQPMTPYPGAYARAPRANSLGSDWRPQQEEARSGVRMGQMAPLGRVIDGIGHRSAGRPLDAGIEYQGGRAVYRVRWLAHNGRRVDYIVDAASGAILSEH